MLVSNIALWQSAALFLSSFGLLFQFNLLFRLLAFLFSIHFSSRFFF